MQQEIRVKKEEFVDKLLEGGGTGRSFYEATRQLAAAGQKQKWQVMDMFPGRSPEEAGGAILEYFGNIVDGSQCSEVPEMDEGPADIGPFSEEEVVDLLKNHKKTNSKVQGDPLPHLVRMFPRQFAIPLTKIYNAADRKAQWPSTWKTEYVTIIPKVGNPSSLAECRNISCTAYFSKVMEGILLKKLRREIREDADQYGGIKGCGAEHMLINIWDRVLSALDRGEEAAAVLGINFEKAFNRMDHGHCIRKIMELGGSAGSARMVAAFLKDRGMKIKIGDYLTERQSIKVGSPQGSVLGCLLYCLVTQTLTTNLMHAPGARPPCIPCIPNTGVGVAVGDDDGMEAGRNVARIPEEGRRPRYFPQDESGDDDDETFVEFWNGTPDGNQEEPERAIGSHERMEGRQEGVLSFKYVDDTTLVVMVRLVNAVLHVSTNKTVQHLTPEMLQTALLNLKEGAEKIGMKINTKKTQLLCISPNNGCTTTASISVGGDTIEDVETLRLVGYTFDRNPNTRAHTAEIAAKFRKKVWMLYHLREAGIKGMRLFKLYCCFVRSVVEYCSPVYHALLSAGEALMLERLQRQVIRICFGFQVDVQEVMEQHCIESLESRRIRRLDKFIMKAFRNPKFVGWFPRRAEDEHNLRNRRRIE